MTYIGHTRQTRNPFILSTITTLVITFIFKRLVVASISFRARGGSKQGIKNEVPRLNAFQFIS